MKIIIDVPNESYAWIKEHTSVRDYSSTTEIVLCDAIRNGVPYEERPTGECSSCRHRDPEDKKCDCGGQERQGCIFPVSDDYFCKFYEKDGVDMRKEAEQWHLTRR